MLLQFMENQNLSLKKISILMFIKSKKITTLQSKLKWIK